MKVELPLAEIVDRVSILILKTDHIHDRDRRNNVRTELESLKESWAEQGLPPMSQLSDWRPLVEVNAALWDVEDALRTLEQKQCFDTEFVRLARSVYRLNDRRADLKRRINLSLGSRLIEEKAYTTYKAS